MEMSSSSMTESGSSSSSSPPNSSTESLNGLKFGQKIYFEDASLGAPYKSGSSFLLGLHRQRGKGPGIWLIRVSHPGARLKAAR
ncbi:squamosa promoter-binding-like protein 9 [Prunus yedoensis var. nudiflora]|uniref:Squamosa promoter-binding-like protein 9 n=1 Tax=Prunus yedoensis var. nudiflora TaxID=2094558 RepID=A0A314YEF2_PRUYE|nr:squamosa promoter-binding-like protein 9 [Prunus yedoensis var. nudiflora]